MTGFVANLSELAALIFNSFRLPSLLPALILALAQALFVFPNLRETVFGKTYFSTDQAGQALILIAITALAAYFLNTLNLTIIRWFEGYPLIEMPFRPGQGLLTLHKNYYLDLVDRRNVVEQKLRKIRSEKGTENPTESEYDKLQTELLSINSELTFFYPNGVERVAPTRLGNVIASAEDQPFTLYKMDSVILWPLLVPVLTNEGYSKFIEQEKASLDFLLNTLIIVAIIGVEIILGGLYNNVAWHILLLIAIAIGAACWVLYNLSIEGALGWGQTIRTAFALYRHKLRQELKIKKSDDFGTERYMWELVSHFYGQRVVKHGDEIFDYSTDEAKSSLEDKVETLLAEFAKVKSSIQDSSVSSQ